MISYQEALNIVLDSTEDYGTETVLLNKALGRVLAEDIMADRDFPPFNRATKDGIALNSSALQKEISTFPIQEVLSAGMPGVPLASEKSCIEIMTGAEVPNNADTVVMYEELQIKKGKATLKTTPTKGQNIHKQGSDTLKGQTILHKHQRITEGVIGVLASVGANKIVVKRLPRILVISTGDELVDVQITPKKHQIRKSNSHTIKALLLKAGITAQATHLLDDQEIIRQKLLYALQEMDVLIISGGVSMGKFDFLPDVLGELGVQKHFHKVAQKPGKPFWFGTQPELNTVVFSFPGNPVSTFVNYHLYFKKWLLRSLTLPTVDFDVHLEEEVRSSGKLTEFRMVKTHWQDGKLNASLVKSSGSGDLVSLAKIDGFIRLEVLKNTFKKGTLVPFIPVKSTF